MQACAGEFGWKTSDIEINFFIALFFSVPRVLSGVGAWAQMSQLLGFFFFILYIFSSSPPLSPNPLLNEPLLLVGVCFVPKVCGAEQRLRTLALC